MIRLHALTCGWITAAAGAFLEGAEGTLRVPVPVYLVEHPKGRVLFDSGLHPELREDPAARLGEIAKFYETDLAQGCDVGGRLGAIGVDPASIDYLVTSHLHFDHVGGHASVPEARLVVQRDEWQAGTDPDLAQANFYDPRDYDLGHDRLLVDGEHDLFGDGTVVCVPTPGHTPGHQSLRVRLTSGDVVLAADACYLHETLERDVLPPVSHDVAAAHASLDRLRALRAAGARIFYGHDPVFWERVPQAPEAIL